MDDRQFQAASAVLDDQRRMIAAGKLQRWDVVKWAVTVNVAVAAASVAFHDEPARMQLFWLAAIVAFIGEVLMLYYNYRLTNTRRDSLKTKDNLANLGATFEDTGSPRQMKSWLYDWQELLIFTLILAMSSVFAAIVWQLSN